MASQDLEAFFGSLLGSAGQELQKESQSRREVRQGTELEKRKRQTAVQFPTLEEQSQIDLRNAQIRQLQSLSEYLNRVDQGGQGGTSQTNPILDVLGMGGGIQGGETTMTERELLPTTLLPFQALVETGMRFVGRQSRMRETQKGLSDAYKARTAVAARALGDAANIAVEERKILEQSFPNDSDTFQSRRTKENSTFDFLNQKENELRKIIETPIPQVLKGITKNGPRYEMDSAAVATRRKAMEGLSAIRQTKVMYKQMYGEAAKLMPPIGATKMNNVKTQSSGRSGGQVMVDAQGNRAIVYPDGTIEELQ